jgi:fructose-specific phosphotransferase system IIC component
MEIPDFGDVCPFCRRERPGPMTSEDWEELFKYLGYFAVFLLPTVLGGYVTYSMFERWFVGALIGGVAGVAINKKVPAIGEAVGKLFHVVVALAIIGGLIWLVITLIRKV